MFTYSIFVLLSTDKKAKTNSLKAFKITDFKTYKTLQKVIWDLKPHSSNSTNIKQLKILTGLGAMTKLSCHTKRSLERSRRLLEMVQKVVGKAQKVIRKVYIIHQNVTLIVSFLGSYEFLPSGRLLKYTSNIYSKDLLNAGSIK